MRSFNNRGIVEPRDICLLSNLKKEESLRKLGLGKYSIWKEKSGIISEGSVWCCGYECYIHVHPTFLGLLWNFFTEYRNDRHLVG